MEKKFKHKTTGEIGYYKDGIFKSGRCCVEIGVPPSSEFWDEVAKDYEILIFNNPDNNLNYTLVDGRYKIHGEFGYCDTGSRNLEYCLNYYTITSVKRLSDGEVFSIGDRTNFGTIVQIQFEENGIKLWLDFQSKSVQHGGYDDTGNYQSLQKIKQDEPKYSLKDVEDAMSGDFFNTFEGFVIKGVVLNILALKK